MPAPHKPSQHANPKVTKTNQAQACTRQITNESPQKVRNKPPNYYANPQAPPRPVI